VVHLLGWIPWYVNCSKKLTISFEIPAKEDHDRMIPIVTSGRESFFVMTYETTVLDASLLKLQEAWSSNSEHVMV
jgi:hypothetical protein